MEVDYKKDGIKNYMIIRNEEELKNDYRLQMIINNDIDGILPLSIKTVNNENQFYYDITAQNSMRSIYSKEKISGKEIEAFVVSLSSMAKSMKEYLLDINNVILDIDYIYWNEKKNMFCFCYYPGNNVSMKDGLVHVFSDMLEMLEHRDRTGVIIGYGLQQMVLSEDVTITELMDFVNQSKNEKNQNKHNCRKIETDKNLIESNEDEMLEEFAYEQSEENKKIKKRKKWWQFWKKEKPMRQEELLQEREGNGIWDREKIVDATMELKEIDEEATILLSSNIQSSGIILRSTDTGNSMTIIPNGFPCIIGKSIKSSDCRINEQFISRVHARINETMDGYYIEDLNSSNGTFLNGEKIMAHTQKQFNIGDTITLADMEFVVE